MTTGIDASPTPFDRGFQPVKGGKSDLSLQFIRSCIKGDSHAVAPGSYPGR
ncbi:hypothetical protein IL54_0481 [Sphingobium sp. ba1]|nr:hypothetical protein IL54_0481 [Sphingobium sp. ba1]